jgi:two-component system sensor histidine kinase HydH
MRFWLMLAALLAIAAVHAGLAVTVSRMVSDQLVQREAQVTQEFLDSLLSAEGSAATLFDQPAPSAALTSFAAHVKSLPGILRAIVYGPDGFIRYSTEDRLTGLQFKDNADLQQAISGLIVTRLEDMDDARKDEQLALKREPGGSLVEAYVPVHGADGKVAAVVELYRSGEAIEQVVSGIKLRIWVAAALSAAILFALFAGVTALRQRIRG